VAVPRSRPAARRAAAHGQSTASSRAADLHELANRRFIRFVRPLVTVIYKQGYPGGLVPDASTAPDQTLDVVMAPRTPPPSSARNCCRATSPFRCTMPVARDLRRLLSKRSRSASSRRPSKDATLSPRLLSPKAWSCRASASGRPGSGPRPSCGARHPARRRPWHVDDAVDKARDLLAAEPFVERVGVIGGVYPPVRDKDVVTPERIDPPRKGYSGTHNQ
jgi:hypothetical protein